MNRKWIVVVAEPWSVEPRAVFVVASSAIDACNNAGVDPFHVISVQMVAP